MKINIFNSAIIKNSIWGVSSNILQTIFVSAFFIIVARRYHPESFAQFLIANTVYQLIAAFSSMGLGQWFIREFETISDKLKFTARFLKIQVILGLAFYFVSIGFAYILYPDGQIRLLCIILGTNIIFDNFINAIKSLNVAEYRQNRTAIVLIVDGFLKLIAGCTLFFFAMPLWTLATTLIVCRILTLGLFIRVGSGGRINYNFLKSAYVSLNDLKKIIVQNWRFIIISSISIIYWRVANIIISKMLELQDVADYEIASAIFSIISIIPVIVSLTVYPRFIAYNEKNEVAKTRRLYQAVFVIYTFFALACYTFIYSFADFIIPLAFGKAYPGAISCVQEMFLTFLVLPTVLLQANLLVSMKLEKLDMYFNIITFLVNVIGCLVGLAIYKDLTVVNYSILLSFIIFHVCQDYVLIKRNLTKLSHTLGFYLTLVIVVLGYQFLSTQLNNIVLFAIFLLASLTLGGYYFYKKREELFPSGAF